MRFWCCLGALLLGPWLTPACAGNEKTVLMVTQRGCEEICRSFQHALQTQGPVRFILRDTGGDASRVAPIVAEARTLRPDLVATWGTGITLATVGPFDAVDPARHLTDIPVVYLYVGNPVESKIARSAERSGRANVAGANTAVPLEAQIRLMASYQPLRRVAMLYNTDEPAAVSQAVAARKAFEAQRLAVSEARMTPGDGSPLQAANIEAALDALSRDQPDFLYYIGSAFTLKHILPLSQGAAARGIPVFSAQEPSFRRGDVLLGLINPLSGIGQVAAYQAGQILFQGKPPQALPSPTLSRHSVLINMRAAHRLKRYPPMKLLQFAEIAQ